MKFLASMTLLLACGFVLREHSQQGLSLFIGDGAITLAIAAVVTDLAIGPFILGIGSHNNRQ